MLLLKVVALESDMSLLRSWVVIEERTLIPTYAVRKDTIIEHQTPLGVRWQLTNEVYLENSCGMVLRVHAC